MKIAVCIKRVPDMETRFKIAADGSSVDQAGLKFDMSDFDGYAVEVALRLKEKEGQGDVTVISLGPAVVQETLRKALSMGADRAVQLEAKIRSLTAADVNAAFRKHVDPAALTIVKAGDWKAAGVYQ